MPFNYFTYGAACSEVELDTLTGDFQALRTHICMDVGSSVNPAIDIGQVEGGFIQVGSRLSPAAVAAQCQACTTMLSLYKYTAFFCCWCLNKHPLVQQECGICLPYPLSMC